MGRAGRVCAQPATDQLRGSDFVGRFAGGWHWFRVKSKLDEKHRKTAKIVPRIAESGLSMLDLIVLVTEICQIKLKTHQKAGEPAKI